MHMQVDYIDYVMQLAPSTPEIVAVHYQGTTFCVYIGNLVHTNDTTLIDSLTRFCLANGNYSVIIAGDFNVHECN